MHLAGESVRRKPFHLGLGIEECAVDFLGRGPNDTMKTNGVRGHINYSLQSVAARNFGATGTPTGGARGCHLRSPNSKPRHNHGSDVIGGILNRIQRRVNLRRVKIDKAQRALRKR